MTDITENCPSKAADADILFSSIHDDYKFDLGLDATVNGEYIEVSVSSLLSAIKRFSRPGAQGERIHIDLGQVLSGVSSNGTAQLKSPVINEVSFASNLCSFSYPNRVLSVKGREVPLPFHHSKILDLLVRNKGLIVPYQAYDRMMYSRSINVKNTLQPHISHLRQKLNEAYEDLGHPERGVIETHARRGYRLLEEWPV